MKRLFSVALVVVALAAVPVALGDNGGSNPSTPGAGTAKQRLQHLRQRIQLAELRFAKHCGTGASGAPQQCVTFAQNVETKLQTLDSKIQAKIQQLQACTATSTDASCTNADKKVAVLQQLDQGVQALIAKVQAWLNGTSTSSSSSSSTNDSGLDQAAAGLGQLSQQAGGTNP